MPAAKELPFSGDFSPGIIPDLGKLLSIVSKSGGNAQALVEAIRKEYFAGSAARRKDPAERLKQQETRAKNVAWALAAYGLLNQETHSLTEIGAALLAAGSPEARSEAFAKHILLNHGGIAVLDAVRYLQRRGTQVSKLTLANALRQAFGFELPRAPTRQTTIINWLSQAGVCGGADARYRINEGRVAQLIGVKQADREDWQMLTSDQKSVALSLRSLSLTHGGEPLPARDVYEYAVNRYGLEAPEDQLANQIFRPLEEGGWLTRLVRGGGRGGKSGSVQTTKKLLNAQLDTVVDERVPNIPADLMRRLQEPLRLGSSNRGTKGIALELLALRMVMDLGLTPTGFRVRGSETGGAEVDLTAEGAHLLFSRWTFQCKNTPKVNLSDLAKEIGMATLLKAHVVVLVATGTFASTVQHFARQVAETTPLQVVLIPGDVVDKYLRSADRSVGVLMEFFRSVAAETMRLKDPQRSQVEGEVKTAKN